MNRIISIIGDHLQLEVRSKREFVRGGFPVLEIVFSGYSDEKVLRAGLRYCDLLAWVRQPIDEKFIEGMENVIIRCKFRSNDEAKESLARLRVASIFDDYWKTIGRLAPAEERHGL